MTDNEVVKQNRKNASLEIQKLVSEAENAIASAEAIADEYNVSFSWDLAYGMGGSYSDGEWHASSESC